MALAGAVSAPPGFLELCERAPLQCAAGRDERVGEEPQAEAIKLEARRRIWAIVFNLGGDGSVSAALPSAPSAGWRVPSRANDPSRSGQSPGTAPSTVEGLVVTPSPSGPWAAPQQDASVTLTPALWSRLTEVNRHVNQTIISRPDAAVYGQVDYWATPIEAGAKVAYGDCEDYVLEKRRSLVAAGLPEAALSIAIVTTPGGDSHAVLLVATDRGELVLDSLSSWISFWNKTGYRWDERQRSGAAFDWVKIATGPILP